MRPAGGRHDSENPVPVLRRILNSHGTVEWIVKGFKHGFADEHREINCVVSKRLKRLKIDQVGLYRPQREILERCICTILYARFSVNSVNLGSAYLIIR
jgi:hypothetical protein